MAITVNSTRENEDDQTVFFSIDYDGTKKWHGDVPKDADPQEWFDANEDFVKERMLRLQYRDADVPQLEDKTPLESFEAWIAGGAKNAEISEERITQAAVPAADAVMGERQKTVEGEEEVTTTEIVEVDGKMVQKEVTKTVVTNTPETKEVPLFDEAGEEVGTTTVPVMESYEITPAVEAVEETSETIVVRPESVVEKTPWKDTVE